MTVADDRVFRISCDCGKGQCFYGRGDASPRSPAAGAWPLARPENMGRRCAALSREGKAFWSKNAARQARTADAAVPVSAPVPEGRGTSIQDRVHPESFAIPRTSPDVQTRTPSFSLVSPVATQARRERPAQDRAGMASGDEYFGRAADLRRKLLMGMDDFANRECEHATFVHSVLSKMGSPGRGFQKDGPVKRRRELEGARQASEIEQPHQPEGVRPLLRKGPLILGMPVEEQLALAVNRLCLVQRLSYRRRARRWP